MHTNSVFDQSFPNSILGPLCARFGFCPSTTKLIQITNSSSSFDYLNQAGGGAELSLGKPVLDDMTIYGVKDRKALGQAFLPDLEEDGKGVGRWATLFLSPGKGLRLGLGLGVEAVFTAAAS
jgi:hypothetical protein